MTMLAGETKTGDQIQILTGSCMGKTAKVISNSSLANMIKIKVKGRENFNLISKKNQVIIVE